MKKLFLLFQLSLSYFLLIAQVDEHSEAPFIKAETNSGVVLDVPLKAVKAEVQIAGIIAQVKSYQTYENTSDEPVNAQYVFPGSTRAAVYGMTMKIGNRTIQAKIKEKQEAQEQFDQAVQEGKTASLLQQHRPNVFQMDMGNIPPHTLVEIELSYTELIESEAGVYEFVYPTIVGKRYDQEVEGSENWTLNPYANLDQGEEPKIKLPSFDIQVKLQTPIPVHGVNVDSHKTSIDYLGKKEVTITLNNGNQTENKDFILKYRMKGDQVETGLMLWEGEEENFFLYMGESPERIFPDEIPPREYFFVVDVSGSMNGFPLDISKELMQHILKDLRPQDKFNVLLFAASSEVLFKKPQSATIQNINQAIRFLDNQNGNGGTNMLSALRNAFKHVNQTSSTSFVILTDGFVTVEKEAFDLISNNLHEANFYPIGIGSSVNRHLIEGIAHIGQSEPFFITRPEQGQLVSSQFKNYVSAPVLTNIQLEFDDFKTYDVIPASIPDLLGERPVAVFGKWEDKPTGQIKLTGISGKGSYENTTKVKKRDIDINNEALKYLWARKKLQTLSDYNSLSYKDEFKTKITEIGLKYSLLSEFTSFLAIDENQQALEQETVVSPNPGAVPEPHEWALIALTAIFTIIVVLKSRLFS